MSWKLQIERKAQKALKKIPNPYKPNLIKAIDQLSENPQNTSTVANPPEGESARWHLATQ